MEKVKGMKKLINILFLFGLIILLGSCATTYWVHNLKSSMDFPQDDLFCQNYAANMAYSLSPPKSPSYDIDVYVNPWTGYGYGTVSPKPDFSGVAKAINTVILYNSCMKELGWRKVKGSEVK